MPIDDVLVGKFIDAAVEDRAAALQLLDEQPSLRQAKWLHGETILHFLAVEGYTEAVRFCGSLGFPVNEPNQFGDVPLIDVAVLGNDEIAEVLLGLGANANARSATRDSVLHCAVRSGNERLVELLLQAGARTDYESDIGESIGDALPSDPGLRQRVAGVLRKYGVPVEG